MKIQTEETVVQEAIEKTGFGKFNLKIAAIGAAIYTNAVISISSTGFVLPAAACDFQMTTIDKGRIAIASVLGSLFGPIVWGVLADLKGRRITLMTTLFIQANCEILMSIVSNYWGFLFLKLFSGFAVIGETSLLFTYVGEFQPKIHQKRILSWISFIMVAAQIIVPLLAWLIIPLDFEYRGEFFFFRSWNLFIFVCALPAEILGIFLIFSPETPKHLAETGQHFRLVNVLIHMYEKNNGGTSDDYMRKLGTCESRGMGDLINFYMTNKSSLYKEDEKTVKKKELRTMINDFKVQGKNVLKDPYLKRLIVLSISMFCFSSSFYSLLMWFPEIFQRFSQFQTLHPNETSSVCSISSHLLPKNNTQGFDFVCKQEVDVSVYKNSLLQGFSAIIPNLLLPLFVDKLGFRFFAVTLLGTAFASTIGLLFANTYLQNVILASIFNAVMSTCASVMYSFCVVLFPTNVRIFASTISVFCSRLGTVFGNVTFTFLIDDFCTILITSVATQLLVATVLSLTLRKK
ncbi:synaptic vesicle glycoprotein 2B-like [Leptopilina boulardi]|uniref:synaptic vesicle glycoprotein 2B-like n=1 Tax=Leptopilina boulardi TaxID=63433 RepID=UPI0021F66D61|nr:synaptic vesicle glycoprotein 2B-like [Leptopilina boulardi]